jgi:hypothetical protein
MNSVIGFNDSAIEKYYIILFCVDYQIQNNTTLAGGSKGGRRQRRGTGGGCPFGSVPVLDQRAFQTGTFSESQTRKMYRDLI